MTSLLQAGPSRKALTGLVLAVLLVHAFMLLGVQSPLTVNLRTAAQADPVHIRMVTPAVPARPPAPSPRPRPRPIPSVDTAAAAKQAEMAQVLNPPEAVAAPAETASQAQTSIESASAPQESATGPSEVEATVPKSASQPPSAWPLISLGALPSSRVLNYQLTGMDKGLTYHASGELRWQHNDTDYELTLAVRAFLIGRRQWRSVGRIEATGLGPVRFSDSWRNERAAHFDRAQQRIVFSSNSNPAVLESGAQDQISLYVQLAAAMAGEPERFVPGTRLQVQTATVRDAQPWSLVLDSRETLKVEGQVLEVAKWVCQPFNRYEARVEFWVAAAQDWLPVRIRITQASGSYIDLLWRGSDPLPALPAGADTTVGTRGS